MNNVQSIINSFNLQDKLDPNIWSLKNGKYTMKPNIRRNLLEIAYDFIDSLNVDVVFSDVVMTGSLANFNWSKYSDVDIHIIVDYNQFPKDSRELYDELFRMKKTIYSNKHDITIYNYDVELYVEDENVPRDTKNVGRFSILNDEWLTYPSKNNIKINVKNIKEKANQWMKIIDGVLDNIEDEDIENAKKLIDKYRTKLRKFRQCGLEKGGEYSEENLVFKILRRNGYLEKLKGAKNKLVDKRLTIKEATTNIGGVFTTDLESGPKNHSKRAFGNWQSDNAWDIFAPAGTIVNSYTEGVVTKVRDTGKNSGKVFGTQVSIKGENGYPNIFYTHLKNVKLTKGQKVKVGDYIGEISEWVGHDGKTHVHIGLPRGKHLRELLNSISKSKIFSGQKGSSPESGSTPYMSSEQPNSSGKSPSFSKEDLVNMLKGAFGGFIKP
jgi:murein DD-endopeptidase MepM/ murein hydrolase activator NlpD